MERFWNIIHYFVYRGDYKLHLLFNYINPVRWILLIPGIKRFYDEKKINVLEESEKAFLRPDIGISNMRTGVFMYLIFFFICFGLINYVSGILQTELDLKLYHFITLIIITLIVNYFLLFKQNKYLTYFKEFDKMPKEDKKKWAWISFVVILGILLFFIGSFVFMIYRYKRN